MRRRPTHRSRGYVLLFVMASLVLISLGAVRLSLRVDTLRRQTAALKADADARLQIHSARSQVFYWIATRPLGNSSSGFIDEPQVVHDGRTYQMADGGYVAIQDDRGLLPLNVPSRDLLLPAFTAMGASFEQASRLIAVLEDYVDVDDLRRINGAEAQDYVDLGLPPPRNRRILFARELEGMPVWRELPDLRSRVMQLGGLRSQSELNPNTAPLEVLKLTHPRIADAQWQLFDSLRRRLPFADVRSAQAATGIPFDEKLSEFRLGGAIRMRLWAPGLAQALEYNFWLLPAGHRSPWHVHAVGQVANSLTANGLTNPRATPPIENFPAPSLNPPRVAEPAQEDP